MQTDAQLTHASPVQGALFDTVMSWFLSSAPLASLLAFITVPAPQRPVSIAAASLLTNVFVGAFLNVAVPRVVRSTWVQEWMSNMTVRNQFYLENPEFNPINPDSPGARSLEGYMEAAAAAATQAQAHLVDEL